VCSCVLGMNLELKGPEIAEKLSESFDELRTNGKRFERVEKIPFMLRHSKHEAPFFRQRRAAS
ncbi:MAG TPA: hypothetical protein VFW91_00905, partial [Candidatus Binatia bacterium]|nr:hypothetical protein [Candidatus Binatia bacterium]